MLKKAGIVVATSAAALLAVSPLAFAGDYDGDNGGNHKGHHSRSHHSNNDNDGSSCKQNTSARAESDRRGGGGLINISRNAIQVPIQACNNNILNNIGVGVLGRGSARGGDNG